MQDFLNEIVRVDTRLGGTHRKEPTARTNFLVEMQRTFMDVPAEAEAFEEQVHEQCRAGLSADASQGVETR
jgi:hypothetical protein